MACSRKNLEPSLSLENSHAYTFQDEDPSNRPPYVLTPLDQYGDIRWRAHCQCGKVSYSLRRERPLKAKFCHCRGCQVLHGAPFQWAAIFPKEDVRFDNGTDGLSFYAARERNTKYQTPTKVTCATCRTPIMDEGRNMCLLFPQLIDFSTSPEEQRERVSTFLPSCHIFYESRLRDIHDGIPKWKGIDEDSEQLDDSGNPLKR
ncbi:hypothetical protein N7481_006118 [Penicillium waksmanii]|uniref:uncharacterized protein n=1 Tax=Penicillium waksmanii TaxID=69791 RepID=UPI002546CED1|nr:uncharacterized protein N7481_006118 [Penicillium waksmanii]KAJ5984019.1 hypothetical protein N7481_006118 [Penicillium waksmanii]